MSARGRNRPKELPETGLETESGKPLPAVRSRADVLRQWEEEKAKEQQADSTPDPLNEGRPANDASASGDGQEVLAAVVAPALPDPSAPPAEQLAVCERHIHEAKARWKAKVDEATEAFVDDAGPFLSWVHAHKLYKLMKDNRGRTYRSWPVYLREQHDLSERTGYRITQTMPILRILSAVGYSVPDLSARQVASLHPVRLQHGEDAVVKVWKTASATMKGGTPTPDELERAKTLLGYTTRPDADEELPAAKSADPGAVVAKAAKLLVPATVREAVRKDPERVRDLVRVLNAALDEVGAPLE